MVSRTLAAILSPIVFLSTVAFAKNDNPEERALWQADVRELVETNDAHLGALYERVDSGKVIGIEILIAAQADGRLQSAFGHSMIRFVDSDADPLNDLVLGFVALIDDPQLNLMKGVKGGYAGYPLVNDLNTFVDHYIQRANRRLERLVIPSTDASRRELIATLKRWIADPKAEGSLGEYTVFDNNCSGMMVRFLEAAGFSGRDRAGIRSRVPVKLEKYYDPTLLSPLPITEISDLTGVYEKAGELLGISKKKVMNGEWPAGSGAKLAQLDVPSRMLLLLNVSLAPTEERDTLAASLPPRSERPKLADAYRIDRLPRVLYGVCADEACAKEFAAAENATFLAADAADSRVMRQKAIETARQADLTEFERALLRHHELIQTQFQ